VLGADRTMTNRIESTVVGLAHNRVDGAHHFHPRLRQQPADHRVGRAPHAERAGEQDRCLEFAQLHHLRYTHELAEAVADVNRSRHALKEGIAVVRKDGGDAGVDGVAAGDGHLADPDSRDIGDRVERTGAEDPRLDAEITDARTRVLREDGRCKDHRDQQRSSHHAGTPPPLPTRVPIPINSDAPATRATCPGQIAASEIPRPSPTSPPIAAPGPLLPARPRLRCANDSIARPPKVPAAAPNTNEASPPNTRPSIAPASAAIAGSSNETCSSRSVATSQGFRSELLCLRPP